jgi:3D (Asp-Asp-Asp) domain-containing protein
LLALSEVEEPRLFLSLRRRAGPCARAALSLLLAAIALASIGCASIAPPRNVEPITRNLEVTAYCACGDCCGWRRTWYGRAVEAAGPNRGKPKQVGMTASGAKARKGTIAADTTRYPFGTIMRIEGYGFGRVEDRGGAIKGDHLDLFFPSHRDALRWGRRRLPVRIWFMPSLRGELLDLESLMAAMEENAENTPATAD